MEPLEPLGWDAVADAGLVRFEKERAAASL
jgi:hypothetical protein